jgi:hypothetical protein
VLPDAPYTEEDIEDLALSLSRNGPYFFGADVRSHESSLTVAKQLSDLLLEMGYDLPSLTAEGKEELESVKDPEAGQKAAEKALKEAQSQSSSSSSSDPSSSSKSTSSTSSTTSKSSSS